MLLRSIAVAGGIAYLTTHFLKSTRKPAGERAGVGGSAAAPAKASPAPAATAAAAGSGDANGALDNVQAVQGFKAAERPELGFPTDNRNDADAARPGLADYARGA